MQCPVCREALVYDLCALKAAPPPQHPLVRDTLSRVLLDIPSKGQLTDSSFSCIALS